MSRAPTKGRRVPSMVHAVRVMGEGRGPAAMHAVELQQMRVHLRIARGVVDPGDLGAALQQGAQGELSHPAKAVQCIGGHAADSLSVRARSSTARCSEIRSRLSMGRAAKPCRRFCRIPKACWKASARFGVRSRGLGRVGQAPVGADRLAVPGRAFLVRGLVADGEDEIHHRRVGGPGAHPCSSTAAARCRSPCPAAGAGRRGWAGPRARCRRNRR